MPSLPAKAFHFVDAANWPAVQQEGLCSTDELLRRGAFDTEVEASVRAHRPEGIALPDGRYIRDQRPMPPRALARCLDPGLAPVDWYALLNGCVFFWLDPERVQRHRAALRGRPQVLLTFDVRALAAAHEAVAHVTPFNIGSAMRKAAPRGLRTLVPLAQWQATAWASEALTGQAVRAAGHRPAELVLRVAAVSDAMRHVTATEVLGAA
ncbi:DUF7002 family protein [Variovorax paradoxus]|uniref:Uncharacterized protein n=1 Tax=Variovorax paradoxus TaxID=34073 RepID=A0A0H2M369_VARPD|nr:hypothetical protein [Variovorax paradoxus]KLN56838.1 hypothetical protein VPARA_20410 [Variovorax paradoxus]